MIFCWTLITLAFIAMSVFLSVWTTNYNYLWFLIIPCLGYFSFEIPVSNTSVSTPGISDGTKEIKEFHEELRREATEKEAEK